MCAVLFYVLFFNGIKFNFAEILSSAKTFPWLFVNDDRITGGEVAEIIHHPYQVSIFIRGTDLCGGFIVSDDWLLTAAHCVYNLSPSAVEVRAGSSCVLDGRLIPISKIVTHPEFNTANQDKDIGAMKTSQPITFSETTKPINIAPQGRHMKARSYFTVSGWGRTEEGGDSPDTLMSVAIQVVWYPICYLSYRGMLTRNMWCGGNYIFGGQAPCEGDSGGTAVQDGLAVGIVSFGRKCGQARSPSVFTDIAAPAIRLFITKHTGL